MTYRLHIVGGKNHGKTTLLVELVQEFTRRGWRVATVKHTSHTHELDTPGKDSHRHRTAGAVASAILSPSLHAVFRPAGAMAGGQAYRTLETLLGPCDLVLVEGDLESGGPSIEVWRAVRQTRPLADTHPAILAVVTDDAPGVRQPVLRRSDVAALVDWLERLPGLAGGRA